MVKFAWFHNSYIDITYENGKSDIRILFFISFFYDRRAELRDETRIIRDIVAQLPSLQQQIFRMKEIEGYTADEIMQITGCSADNLRRNLSRARTKIRETYIKIMMKGTRK